MHPGAFAKTQPNKPAVIMAGSGETVTYKQLDERSNQLAQLLYARGLRVGDHIALCMENNAFYHEVLWAGWRSGLYFTAISSRLTAGEIDYIVNDCGASALIMGASKADQAADLLSTTPNVHTRLMIGGTIDGYESYEEVVRAQPTTPLAHEELGQRMLYSSGTTGRPKGILTPLAHVDLNTPDGVTMSLEGPYKGHKDMVYLSPAPLYHAAPLAWTLSVTRLGGTLIIMEHFDAVEFLKLIEQYHVTHTQVVPTMFVRMLKLPKEERERFDHSSLEMVIHAAAPCPVPVKEAMIEWWGPVLGEYYAGSEGSGSTSVFSEEWLQHKGTVGHGTSEHTTIHIVDEEGNELPAGEPGTIYFESAAAQAFEYHNDPEKTAAARHPKGWSTLGDIGYLDADGYLFLTDRKANMIISGGVNIYPQEAENVLTMHPKVVDVAVFGVPNEDLGEEVKAVVQPLDMADAGPELEAELIAYCRSQLAGYKCPRSIDFDPELPRHPTGKLYKRLVRDRYWVGHSTRLL